MKEREKALDTKVLNDVDLSFRKLLRTQNDSGAVWVAFRASGISTDCMYYRTQC